MSQNEISKNEILHFAVPIFCPNINLNIKKFKSHMAKKLEKNVQENKKIHSFTKNMKIYNVHKNSEIHIFSIRPKKILKKYN